MLYISIPMAETSCLYNLQVMDERERTTCFLLLDLRVSVEHFQKTHAKRCIRKKGKEYPEISERERHINKPEVIFCPWNINWMD